MKKILLCLLWVLSILVLFGCSKPSNEDFNYSNKSLDEISDEGFLSLVDSYENDIYQSLYEINGEKYGRIISSSDSLEDAVRVGTRHFTDNRHAQAINTVTECKVIYVSDFLYGINVKWKLTNHGEFKGQYEENVISFKKEVADITVRNVIYDDVESFRICTNQKEQIKQIVLYLFHNKYFGQKILDYEMLSYDEEYIITIYSYDACYGDWGVSDEYRLIKHTVVVNEDDGEVNCQEPTILKTVYR